MTLLPGQPRGVNTAGTVTRPKVPTGQIITTSPGPLTASL